MILLFEIVISNCSRRLQSALEIVGVFRFLNNYLLINIFPFLDDTLSLYFIVSIQSLIEFFCSDHFLGVWKDKYTLRISWVSYVYFVIVNYCSDSTSANVFDFFITEFKLLFINFIESIL